MWKVWLSQRVKHNIFQSSESSVNPVDSSTFVRPHKAKTDDIIETEEETDMAAMDYEQLMSYFESLKESSAWSDPI